MLPSLLGRERDALEAEATEVTAETVDEGGEFVGDAILDPHAPAVQVADVEDNGRSPVSEDRLRLLVEDRQRVHASAAAYLHRQVRAGVLDHGSHARRFAPDDHPAWLGVKAAAVALGDVAHVLTEVGRTVEAAAGT